MIVPTRLRTLDLEKPTQPGRPAHVSAASGLVRAGEFLYVVPDDENHLGIFPDEGARPGTLARIAEGTLPLGKDPRKRRKPDFESLARLPAFGGHPHGALLALGSCSKPNRCRGVALGLDAPGHLDGSRREIDLAQLRDALESRFGRLNIEGAVVLGQELVLMQRGNKGDRRNARIRLRLDAVLRAIGENGEIGMDALVDIHEHELGAIGEVPLCFSDVAALPDGRLVFTAIAEDTLDSYEDGRCVGAAVGVMDGMGRLGLFEPLEGCPKVEGIEVMRGGGPLEVLLVTDADDDAVPAALLWARLGELT
jgi:hypothetical protein